MTLATDMERESIVGGIARFDPARLIFSNWHGFSVLNPVMRRPFAQEWSTGFNGATSADAIDRMVITMATTGGNNFQGMIAPGGLPPAPYTLDIAVAFNSVTQLLSTGNSCCGIFLHDGIKIESFSVGTANSLRTLLIETWTNSTTQSTNLVNTVTSFTHAIQWFRLTDDGTTRSMLLSVNGKEFLTVFHEASGTFLTPNAWGVGGIQNQAAGTAGKYAMYHWQVSPGVLGDLPY